jgi:hypothetical protein
MRLGRPEPLLGFEWDDPVTYLYAALVVVTIVLVVIKLLGWA